MTKPAHILIVDDDVGSVEALGALLEDEYDIRFALTGRQALDMATAAPPNLVLLDVRLPDIDGYDVCERLMSSPVTSDVPVIFITALASPTDEAHGLEKGAVDYITKPFRPAIVRARIRNHLQLRRNESALKTFKAAVDHSSAGIVITDRNATIEYVNGAFTATTGYDAAKVIGLTPSLFKSGTTPAAVYRDLWETILAGRSWRGELLNQRKDGSVYWNDVAISPVQTREGLITHFVAVMGDVTGRRRAEADLRAAKEAAEAALVELERTQARLIQSEKMAALGHLVAGVAHEINTPIGTAMTGASFLAEQMAVLKERMGLAGGGLRRRDLQEFLRASGEVTQLIMQAMERSGTIIRNFKEIAAEPAREGRCRFALARVLRDFAGLAAYKIAPPGHGPGHTLTVDCPEDLMMEGLPAVLTQVLNGLLANSLQHAYPDGRLGRLRLAAELQEDGSLRLIYADDGVGIPTDLLPSVFEAFVTTKRHAGHAGLGLHIVFNLVNRTLGGTIAVASVPGEGARFTLDLPLVAPVEHVIER